MNTEEIRIYCLNKKGVTEGFPFDDTTLVFKVMNKIFALMRLDEIASINLKCDPELAIELRERFDFVIPGYHMNKQHWNTIQIDSCMDNSLIREWIDHSYELIVSKLPQKSQVLLLNLNDNL